MTASSRLATFKCIHRERPEFVLNAFLIHIQLTLCVSFYCKQIIIRNECAPICFVQRWRHPVLPQCIRGVRITNIEVSFIIKTKHEPSGPSQLRNFSKDFNLNLLLNLVFTKGLMSARYGQNVTWLPNDLNLLLIKNISLLLLIWIIIWLYCFRIANC